MSLRKLLPFWHYLFAECNLVNSMAFVGSELGAGATWEGARVAAVCAATAKQHHPSPPAAGEGVGCWVHPGTELKLDKLRKLPQVLFAKISLMINWSKNHHLFAKSCLNAPSPFFPNVAFPYLFLWADGTVALLFRLLFLTSLLPIRKCDIEHLHMWIFAHLSDFVLCQCGIGQNWRRKALETAQKTWQAVTAPREEVTFPQCYKSVVFSFYAFHLSSWVSLSIVSYNSLKFLSHVFSFRGWLSCSHVIFCTFHWPAFLSTCKQCYFWCAIQNWRLISSLTMK